jgi:hypothetical protein
MSPSNYSQTNSAVVTVGSGSSNWSVSTGDNTPTAFTFTDQSGVATNTLFSSNILQITGINIASAVSISGSGSPQFRICSDSTCVAEVNTWGSGAQTITNNQYLQLRLTSGASYSIINSAIINVGLGASTWNVATLDNTPDAFSFTNQTSLNLNTSTASNTIQITGITMPSAVTISGSGTPEFRICDDASCYTILQDWGSAGQNISNNQYIQLRLTSSGSYATTDTVTVSIGAGTTNWTAKTKEQYALDASAGANGTISPTGTLTANQGDTQVYTFTPSAHYHVSNITVDGVSQTLANSYTFANIQAAHTISVAFAADTFTITATNGANGSVSPGTTTLGYNANQTFTISPYANFHIVDVLVDSVSVGAVGTYTFNNISANHTLAATFAASDITINSSAGANGTITPLGASSVTYGANQTFVINPYSGYQIAGVAVDSVSVGAVGSYTFNNVTTNHTINAWFAPIAFTLTYSAGANGFISGTPTQTVGYGANGTAVTATGNGIYAFGSWSDGSTQNPRTDTNVTTNITVTANFINPYTVECTPATAIGAKCGGGIKYADGYVAMPPGCTDVTNEPTCNVPGYLTDTVTKYYSASAFDEPADSLTNGRLNTNSLMGNPADNGSATDSLAPNDPAALYCFNMILNTKTDWYLPAKDELNVLYGQRVAVGGFFAGTYWSSSENTVTNVGYYAWNQNFSTGAQGGSNYKYSSSYYVRCIRAY